MFSSWNKEHIYVQGVHLWMETTFCEWSSHLWIRMDICEWGTYYIPVKCDAHLWMGPWTCQWALAPVRPHTCERNLTSVNGTSHLWNWPGICEVDLIQSYLWPWLALTCEWYFHLHVWTLPWHVNGSSTCEWDFHMWMVPSCVNKSSTCE